MTRRIAIVGAGWAGLACALAAAEAGAEVDVHERRDGPAASPMHVAVVPNMMRDLASLGLAEACVRAGFPYRSLTIGNNIGHDAGSLRLEIPYRRLAGEHRPAALGLQQQSLTALLVRAALDRGVRIHWGHTVTGLRLEGGTARLELGGTLSRAADITLLATGADSALRERHFPAARPTERGSNWWTSVLHRPAGLDQLTWLLAAPYCRALLVPVNDRLAGVALIAPEIDAMLQGDRPHGAAARQLRAWLGTQPKALAALASLLADDAPVQPLPVRSALLDVPWYRGSVLCVGDAAHLLPPHMAQSGPQAFEDAVVFGELLRDPHDVSTLLEAYMARRAPRVRAVFEITERASRWDHGPSAETDIPATAAALAAVVEVPA